MANIFQQITADDQNVISQEVTTGLWTGDTGSLSAFYTSDTQLGKANSKYFVDVYNVDPSTTSSAEVQFSIGYGHIDGDGSPTLNQSDTSTLATKAVYLQMKNLLLDPTDSRFNFYNSTTSEDIYVLAVSRARYKGYLDPGNWLLTLSGSNGKFTFIDDSLQTLGTRRSFATSGLSFNIVSGSLSGANGSTIAAYTGSDGGGFGTFYPQKGILVLNATAVQNHVGFLPRTGSLGLLGAGGENTASATVFSAFADTLVTPLAPYTGSLTGVAGVYQDQYNWHGLYRSIELGDDFQARSAEIVASTHYFLRLKNRDFNYSNNPTFATGSNGQVINSDFEKDPRVFVTSVGLYNDSNELLAVAKLSRPLEKSFSKEALIRVKLDF